jgi:hypothetical protein
MGTDFLILKSESGFPVKVMLDSGLACWSSPLSECDITYLPVDE